MGDIFLGRRQHRLYICKVLLISFENNVFCSKVFRRNHFGFPVHQLFAHFSCCALWLAECNYESWFRPPNWKFQNPSDTDTKQGCLVSIIKCDIYTTTPLQISYAILFYFKWKLFPQYLDSIQMYFNREKYGYV